MGGLVRSLVMLSVATLSSTALTLTAGAASMTGGRFDRPQPGFADPDTVLRSGDPAEVGVSGERLDAAFDRIAAWTETTPERAHPMYAGAVGLVAHQGTVVHRAAAGHELRYSDETGAELPPQQRERAHEDTIFDIASVTKLFTSIAALREVDDGRIELDTPVAEYLPEFGTHGKDGITVRQLLTHTSGLPAEVQLWTLPPTERVPAVLDLEPERAPGTSYTYSDPNMITLGLLVERVTGNPLDEVVADGITEPLGMADTGYRPSPDEQHRIAATEYQSDPDRGMVRGEVHDENAWSLDGVAGHAGIFSTADDLAVLGQTILNGGTYDGTRVLSEWSTRAMLTNFNTDFPEDAHGLGFELDQRWYMAGLSGPRTAGHTGFTGTSLVLDPDSGSIAVLLTNRVHPTREWGSNNAARETLAHGLAGALAVRPTHGATSWFAADTATLRSSDLGPVRGDVDVRFDAFVDTQRDSDGTDALILESTVDGRRWEPVPVRAHGRGAPGETTTELAGYGHRSWWHVHAAVPAEPGEQVRLRWRYAPDAEYSGRGVHLDGIRAHDPGGTLLDGEREPERFAADGWIATSR